MNAMKSRMTNRLDNSSLESCLRLSLAGLPVDINKFAAQKQVQSPYYLHWYNHYCAPILVLSVLIKSFNYLFLPLPLFFFCILPTIFAALYRLARESQKVEPHWFTPSIASHKALIVSVLALVALLLIEQVEVRGARPRIPSRCVALLQ
jgi:hypothetical protein